MSAEWDDLARLAQAATPGPWEHTTNSVLGPREASDISTGPILLASMQGPFTQPRVGANAEFIAAANPATILHLITELRDTKGAATLAMRTLTGLIDDLARAAGVDNLGEQWDDQIVDIALETVAGMAARLAAVEALANDLARPFPDGFPDREGEVIAEHLRAALAAPTDTTKENQ